MTDGRARKVPSKIDSIAQLDAQWFPILTSPKHKDLIWAGSMQLSDGAKKFYKSTRAAEVTNKLVRPPIPGTSGSKDYTDRILEYVIEEHNAERLPSDIISIGARGVFPAPSDATLVFPLGMYVENRDDLFGKLLQPPHLGPCTCGRGHAAACLTLASPLLCTCLATASSLRRSVAPSLCRSTVALPSRRPAHSSIVRRSVGRSVAPSLRRSVAPSLCRSVALLLCCSTVALSHRPSLCRSVARSVARSLCRSTVAPPSLYRRSVASSVAPSLRRTVAHHRDCV